MYQLVRHYGTIINGKFYYSVIAIKHRMHSGMQFHDNLAGWFDNPRYPHEWYEVNSADIIAEADTLEELKLSVPYLFL